MDGMHTAIIMDGNGRWAAARGLPRQEGHRAGARTVRAIIEAAPRCGISTLTLYAFSSDNWKRPRLEVDTLMDLMRRTLRDEARRCVQHGIRLSAIGRRDRLPSALRNVLDQAERDTAAGRRLHVRLAIDYSSRDALVEAARCGVASREAFTQRLGAPDVDLLIRTGGEQRLSDFLLWECAYAELYFSPLAWPDFGPEPLREAVAEFHRRHRRFGGLTPAA
jgi:undecaprenyl diphosphate synthase